MFWIAKKMAWNSQWKQSTKHHSFTLQTWYIKKYEWNSFVNLIAAESRATNFGEKKEKKQTHLCFVQSFVSWKCDFFDIMKN